MVFVVVDYVYILGWRAGECFAGNISTREFSMERKSPGGELVRGNYTLREFPRIPLQNPF